MAREGNLKAANSQTDTTSVTADVNYLWSQPSTGVGAVYTTSPYRDHPRASECVEKNALFFLEHKLSTSQFAL